MQVSAGRVTLVLLKGVHAGAGRSRRKPQVLQITAVPLQTPPLPALAVKDTCRARRMGGGGGKRRDLAGDVQI